MEKQMLEGLVETKVFFTETISKYEEILVQIEKGEIKAEDLPWCVLQDRLYCHNLKLNEMIHAGQGQTPEREQLVMETLRKTIDVYWDGIKMIVEPAALTPPRTN